MKDKNRQLRHEMLLIAFGVALFAALMNLRDLWQGFLSFLGLLSPVLLGLGFALILNVPLRGFAHLFERLDKKGRMKPALKRILSLTLTILAMPLLFYVMGRFIVPQFLTAVNGVVDLIRNNAGKIGELASQVGLDPNIVSERLSELSVWISKNVGNLAGTAVSTIANLFSSVASVFMSLMLSIYLLAQKDQVKRQMRHVLYAFAPRRFTDNVCRIGQMFIHTFSVFLSRQCLEAMILGTLVFLGMLIFGLPYAVSLSCLTAVLALIPFVGAYLSFFLGVVMIVMLDPSKALAFGIWFLVAQQIEGNVIYPHIVGSSVGLPAYVTLTGVFLGGAIAGIPGMVLIIPIVSVLYQLLHEAVTRRIAQQPEAAAGEKEA